MNEKTRENDNGRTDRDGDFANEKTRETIPDEMITMAISITFPGSFLSASVDSNTKNDHECSNKNGTEKSLAFQMFTDGSTQSNA